MTAKTSQKLADALREAGFEDLALRAEADEFHDFLSPHELPGIELEVALLKLANMLPVDVERRDRAYAIRVRHHEGEFDATLEESDAWAESEEGKAVFQKLMEGL